MADVKGAPKYETGFMRKTSDFRPGFNTMYRGNKMGTVYRFPGTVTPDGKEIPAHPQSDNGKMEMGRKTCCCTGNGPLPMYIEPPITKKSRGDLLRRISLHADHGRPQPRLLPPSTATARGCAGA